MIPRYTRKEMSDIWTDANRFHLWFLIEAHALDKMAMMGTVPAQAAKDMWERGHKEYTPQRIQRINELENDLKHDVIAFLTELSENVGENARFIHQGMTSSDILDSAFHLQLKSAADIIIENLKSILTTLKKKAQQYKNTLCIGRSHGIHAEPITFGLKMASFYAQFQRHLQRMIHAREEISTIAISGAVGHFAHVAPQVEEHVAKKLQMNHEPVSTQVLPRDRAAAFFNTLALIASGVEQVATEIRHLQRTEVREVFEFFHLHQKGSSAMPHKKNPILTENLTGLARLIRSMALPAMENVALWHERDISHSCVERNIGPDATVTLNFALHRLQNVLENMIVDEQQMMKNVEMMRGLIFSQKLLLSLTQAGVNREQGYRMVQKHALRVWQDQQLDFVQLVKDDPDIGQYISNDQMEKIFSMEQYTHNINAIFARIFKEDHMKMGSKIS